MTAGISDRWTRETWSALRGLCWSFAKSLVLGGVSSLAWSSGHLWMVPLCLLFPLLLSWSRTGRDYLLLAAGYFAGALWPMIPGAHVFFGNHLDPVKIILLYAAWVLLLAGPFYLLGYCVRAYQPWIAVTIVLLESLTPLGLASPLIAAGSLFPGWRWFGLLLTILACLALAQRSGRGISLLAIGSALAWILAPLPARPSATIQLIQTQWGGSGFNQGSFWNDYGRLQQIAAKAQPGHWVIFPESTLPAWAPGLSETWLTPLLPPGSIVLFGTEYHLKHRQRQPVVLVRGAVQAEYRERFPVPVAMWGYNTPLHYFGPGSLPIGSRRAGVLLCYEQLLPIAAIETLWEKPDVLIAPANLYWAQNTTINQSEELCVRAWAQLFHLPYYRAVNQ